MDGFHNSEKLISVIVPMYNCEKTIDRCIQSVLNQETENWELLLVDDGSIDTTVEKCNNYINDNDKVRIYEKENGGPSSARNYGIENAKGDYLVFLDSDDFFDNNHISSLKKVIDSKKPDTIFCGYKAVYENGDIAEVIIPKYDKSEYIEDETINLISRFIGYSMEDFYAKLNGIDEKQREFAAVWRFCYSREIIKENNILFDEAVGFGEDIIFNSLYLAFCKKLIITDITSYNYQYSSEGLVQQFLHEDGIKLCNHKMELMKAREKATVTIKNTLNFDISDIWEGSTLFSVMHIGITMAQTKESSFKTKYRVFKKYAKSDMCTLAVQKMKLSRVKFKYKVCYFPIKIHAYLMQYFMLKVASVLHIAPGVED